MRTPIRHFHRLLITAAISGSAARPPRTPRAENIWLACLLGLALVQTFGFAHLAAAQDISAALTQTQTWLTTIVQVVAGLMLVGCFLLFAAGRFHWGAGIVLIAGLAGALKAQTIVTSLGLGG